MSSNNITIPDNEDEAQELFWAMKSQFGWAGTFMRRSDVEFSLGRDMTDDEWESVKNSPYWHKVIPGQMALDGNEIIPDVLDELGISNDDELEN